MKREIGNYRSRKSRKRALHFRQIKTTASDRVAKQGIRRSQGRLAKAIRTALRSRGGER